MDNAQLASPALIRYQSSGGVYGPMLKLTRMRFDGIWFQTPTQPIADVVVGSTAKSQRTQSASGI